MNAGMLSPAEAIPGYISHPYNSNPVQHLDDGVAKIELPLSDGKIAAGRKGMVIVVVAFAEH